MVLRKESGSFVKVTQHHFIVRVMMETKNSVRKMQHVNGEMPKANACRHESQFTIRSVIMGRLLEVYFNDKIVLNLVIFIAPSVTLFSELK